MCGARCLSEVVALPLPCLKALLMAQMQQLITVTELTAKEVVSALAARPMVWDGRKTS